MRRLSGSKSNVFASVFAGIIALLCLWLAMPGDVRAHPSGDYSVNHFVGIELYRGELRIRYVADYSEIPSLQWFIRNDADDDSVVSSEEMERFLSAAADDLGPQLAVRFDGQPLELRPVHFGGSYTIGDQGTDTLRMEIIFAATEVSGTGVLEVDVTSMDASPGWTAMTLSPSEGTGFAVSDPQILEDPSAGLTAYPDLWKSFPPLQRVMEVEWDAETGIEAPVQWFGNEQVSFAAVTRKGTAGDSSLPSMALALLTAFALGVVDSLGPGHGKTVVASYFAGRAARFSHAAGVAAFAALSHALFAILLGMLAAYVSSVFLPQLFEHLQVVAGVSAIAIGLAMLSLRLRRRQGLACDHTHDSGATRRGFIPVGILSGLIPCPTSIVLMLSAISLGSWMFAIVLAAAFSVGTGVALLLVGVASVAVRRYAVAHRSRISPVSRLLAASPVIGAFLVIVAGCVMVHQAVSGQVL